MTNPAVEGGRIVVGVDGSSSSKAALRWAVGQAHLTGAIVDAVTAWQMPASYAWIPDGVTGIEDFGTEARRILTEAINEIAGVDPGVKVRPFVEEGHPAQVLVDAAKGAQLLVVGSRGHGEFAAALLGSVSQNCVHHAPCPVLVIRGDDAS
jgi:nucleotide-binding universal stress UspA family protein